MEKKNHSNSDFKRLLYERDKLINGAKKVPYSQKEVANLPFYGVVYNQQTEGV